MENDPFLIRAINFIARPFGWKRTREYVGNWRYHNGKVYRTRIAFGWRWARLEESEGMTSLDIFKRDHGL